MLTVAIREAGKTEFELFRNVKKVSLSMVGRTLTDARLFTLEDSFIQLVDLFNRNIAAIEVMEQERPSYP